MDDSRRQGPVTRGAAKDAVAAARRWRMPHVDEHGNASCGRVHGEPAHGGAKQASKLTMEESE